MKLFKLLSLSLIFTSALILSGCGSNPTPTTNVAVNTPPTPPVVTNTEAKINLDADITEEAATDPAEGVEEEAMSADPAQGNYTIANVESLISGFKLKDNPQFVSCSYESISNCQTQVSTEAAMTEKNVELCDNIADKAQATSCKDQLWTQLASLEDDVELCVKISDDYSKNYCQDQYWRAFASAESNVKSCEKINEPYAQDECANQIQMQIAVTAQDAALCKSIKLYEYTFADTANPDATDEERIAAENAPPQRVALPDDQNYVLQDCEQQVASSIEFAAQAAAEAEEQARRDAEYAAQEEANAIAQAAAEEAAAENETETE